jgi:23S rRNA (cytidine1920-2'-O)/16S rRNA (cytidine1409-2'-O)-methyltransferase
VSRRRLDTELVRRGLAASRAEAQVAIREGKVTIGGAPAAKASTLVDAAEPVALVAPARRFVSRGGEKLEAALVRFGIDPAGRRCLDAGASTGGFTDCLLQRGARHVVAVDVGYGQLAWSIRSDERVSVLERTNVRDLGAGHLPYAPDLVVADLSFISLRLVVPALATVSAGGADLVLLVKPQFEAGPAELGSGGVVRDPGVWRPAVERVAATAAEHGLGPLAVMASPLRGPAGNVEFPIHLRKGHPPGSLDVDAAVDEGRRVAGAA